MFAAVAVFSAFLFSSAPSEIPDGTFWVYTRKPDNDDRVEKAVYQARRMVRDYYVTFLRRAPSKAELERRVADLLAVPPRYDSLGLIMQLYDSPEFDTVHNVTPEMTPRDFVRMAFRTVLEREPSEPELALNIPLVLNPACRRRGFFEVLAGCAEAQARNGKSEGQGSHFTYTAQEGKLGLLFRGEGALAKVRAWRGSTTGHGAPKPRPMLTNGRWGPVQPLAEGPADISPQLVIRVDPRLGEVWYLFNRDLQYSVNPGAKPVCCGEPFQITVRASYDRGESWTEEVPVATPGKENQDDWAIADGEAVFDGASWHLLAQCAASNPGLFGWKICHYSLNGSDPLAGPFAADRHNPVVRIAYPWFWDYPVNFGNYPLPGSWDDIWRQFVCPEANCSTADFNHSELYGRYDYRVSGTPAIVGQSFGSYVVAVHGWRDFGDPKASDSRTALVRTRGFSREGASAFGIERLQTSFRAIDAGAREALPYGLVYDKLSNSYVPVPKEMLGPADCRDLFSDGGKTCVGAGHISILRDGAYYYALVETPTVSLVRSPRTRAAGQLWPFLLYRSPRLGASGTWEPFWGGPLIAAKDAKQPELLHYAKLVKTREDVNDPDYEVLVTFTDVKRQLPDGGQRTDFYIFKVTGAPSPEVDSNRSWRFPD